MVTDLAEVRRLGAAKSAENLEFRRFLTAHHQRIEGFQAVAMEVQRHIDCRTCANCCRNSIVSVNAAEIEQIARYAGKESAEFARHFTTQDPDSSQEKVLASNESGCVFLEGNLCGVYPARPKACREFPHVTAGTHSLGGRIESICRWAPFCPVVYNALEAYKHLLGFRVDGKSSAATAGGCGV